MNKKEESATSLYLELMEEIKSRLDCTHWVISGGNGMPKKYAQEFCFLQLRMSCELIALGCLVAHGDLEGASPLAKKYAADEIVNRLEGLHSDFFPRPGKFIRQPDSSMVFEPRDQGYLSKAGLVDLYVKCGDLLHKGRLKNLQQKRSFEDREASIRDWLSKIRDLLFHHVIHHKGYETGWGVQMVNEPPNGPAALIIFIADELL